MGLAQLLSIISYNNLARGVNKEEPLNSLMTTIILPSNLNSLNSRLPRPNYKYLDINTAIVKGMIHQ